MSRKLRVGWINIGIVNIARLVVSLTLIFSGYVKAVDPIGLQYKLQDYAEALNLQGMVPDLLTLTASVTLSSIEFALGIFLLFAMMRRLITRTIVLFLAVMTAVTIWLWIDNPISDCGCFGDAIHLTNGETLAKNVILLLLATVTSWRPLSMPRFISISNQWIVFHYTLLFILGTSAWSLYDLPVLDFRPYHTGVNIIHDMEIPEGEKQPEFETTFIMEKNGVRKEFSLEEYPDSTWTFIDSKTVQTSEGYIPPIHDFSIADTETGDDITEDVLSHKGYTFLLISPHLEQADDSNFGNIDIISEYAREHNYPFYCLTASNDKAISHWIDITGAEYPFCHTDETTLKTVIRSNPGLLLLHNGTIIGKWSHNHLPADKLGEQPLSSYDIGSMDEGSSGKRLLLILLMYVMPLTLLVIADRLWMWSKWVKGKEKIISELSPLGTTHNNKGQKSWNIFKSKHNNEKENRCRQLENEQEPAGGRSSR